MVDVSTYLLAAGPPSVIPVAVTVLLSAAFASENTALAAVQYTLPRSTTATPASEHSLIVAVFVLSYCLLKTVTLAVTGAGTTKFAVTVRGPVSDTVVFALLADVTAPVQPENTYPELAVAVTAGLLLAS